MSSRGDLLMSYYKKLSVYFGPQEWWPGDSRFEVLVGTILTQNTSWANAAKAIENLKIFRLLDPHKLNELDLETIEEAVRPSGYFRQKARRLQGVARWLVKRFDGDLEEARRADPAALREELLAIKGIGPETADSILLYALDLPAFVVDTYTYRVLSRHDLVGEETSYEEMQELFTSNLPEDVRLFNEYHALLVEVGKKFCRTRAQCDRCPLKVYLP